MKRGIKLCFILLGFLILSSYLSWTALGSSGDREYEFLSCLNECNTEHCLGNSGDKIHKVSWMNQLLGWNCDAECKYSCMHEVTYEKVVRGRRIHQYYGKWPFFRIFWMQEPASVLFSILNFIQHYRGYKKLYKNIPQHFPLRNLYIFVSLTAMNAWIWSTVFHTRDLRWTESADYFSAMLYILSGTYQAIIRVYGWFNPDSSVHKLIKHTLAMVCIVFYICHVSYLTFWRFDYSYNMISSIVVGTLGNLHWIGWCFSVKTKERPYKYQILKAILCLSAAMSLELLDFPPYLFILDAHALWHLATVPIVPMFYEFLLNDIRFEVMRMKSST